MGLFVIFIISGYLIGSISFARVIAACYSVDITKVGSGNPGATNVNRQLGRRAGILVFIGDFLKSFIVVFIALKLKNSSNLQNTNLAIVSMLSVIIGHNFPIFFKFKGGKGVSSTMGGLLALMPSSLAIGLLIWLVIFHATRFVSLASLFFAISLPITAFVFGYPTADIFFVLFIDIIIFWRHKENIRKLYRGSEYRFVKKY